MLGVLVGALGTDFIVDVPEREDGTGRPRSGTAVRLRVMVPAPHSEVTASTPRVRPRRLVLVGLNERSIPAAPDRKTIEAAQDRRGVAVGEQRGELRRSAVEF